MIVGVVGSLVARFSRNHRTPLVVVIAGVLMLVPGSIAVRGLKALTENNTIDGARFAFVMLVTRRVRPTSSSAREC